MRSRFRGLAIPLLVWWLWLPAGFAIWLFFVNVVFEGYGSLRLGTWRWFDAWFAVDSGQRWFYVLVGAVGTMVIVSATAPRRSGGVAWAAGRSGNPARRSASFDPGRPEVRWVLSGLAALLAVTSVVLFIRAVWDNEKDLARFYQRSTTFVVPDLKDPPAAIDTLVNGNATGDRHRCDLLGPHGDDVPACLRQGKMPPKGWQSRPGSLAGAEIIMTRSSSASSNVELMDDTFTYLSGRYPGGGTRQKAAWSAIRDGSGWETPLYGVVEWTGGSDAPTECLFRGDHRIDRAFDGSRDNSLLHLLNDRYPRLVFDRGDAWGYCAGQEPVIVLPAQRQIHFKQRTVMVAAGVVMVRGSRSGGAVFDYQPTVRTGQLPGPVYPDSLVKAQRDTVKWAGGRRLMNRQGFGLVPGKSSVQAGNDSDYLLRSADDGRLYWVTPLVPRRSDSQQFVAYETVPADEVTAGQLNPLTDYVLDQSDPRVVNLDQFVASATDFLSQADPGLVSSGGKIVEFLPLSGDIWQGYVEVQGRVVYRITLSYHNRIPVELVTIGGQGRAAPTTAAGGGTATGPPGAAATTATRCGQPPGQLSDHDLAVCIQALAAELAARGATAAPAQTRPPAAAG
jgi:hypothetical protein